MVTKVASVVDIDLSGGVDFYGVENDFIFILATNGNRFSSYAGNDVIDGSRASFSAFVSEISSGLGDDHVHGTGGQDWIYDGLGNDTIVLGAGNDRMFADGGNDIYYGGIGIDTVDFSYFNYIGASVASGENTFGVKFDLASLAVQNLGIIGFDQFFGFENAVGSDGNDSLFGTALANTLDGSAGNDALLGRGGDDQLNGNLGSDVLIGGLGADVLDVGEGLKSRDILRYAAANESGLTPTTRDAIVGFEKGTAATADRIDLSLLDGNTMQAGDQPLVFMGTANFVLARGEVRYQVEGTNIVVYVDTDADADAEMSFLVADLTSIAGSDFIL